MIAWASAGMNGSVKTRQNKTRVELKLVVVDSETIWKGLDASPA